MEKRKQLDKIDNYLMQVNIAIQPHLDKQHQGKLVKQLQQFRTRLDPPPPKTEEEIDKGINVLRRLM